MSPTSSNMLTPDLKTPKLTVIICAHNPQPQPLARVLQALATQTLPLEQWELLLIDNASDRPLAHEVDLSWHPQARHIQEAQLGLTPARLTGIQQAQAEVLVFVDDDNVLDADYLENVDRISQEWAVLGAWGGQIRPEFAKTPPDWTKPYWKMLAIRHFDCDRWSNIKQHHHTAPCGAGMCVRKSVAEQYAKLVQQDARRMKMGRRGDLLTSCEDSDLAFTACDMGLGTGLFVALKLTHLISATRLQEEYLLRLVKGLAYSSTLLHAFRGTMPIHPCRSQRLIRYYKRWRMDARSRQFHDASQAGKALAIQEIASWET
jgi:glycosyltransferase involved in cell wall biosynthesis